MNRMMNFAVNAILLNALVLLSSLVLMSIGFIFPVATTLGWILIGASTGGILVFSALAILSVIMEDYA